MAPPVAAAAAAAVRWENRCTAQCGRCLAVLLLLLGMACMTRLTAAQLLLASVNRFC
jgi:hypothetical protein